MFDLICLGNITVDNVYLPNGVQKTACFGGDAIYAALSGKLWSDQVDFVAPIGNDFPSDLFELLQKSDFESSGMPIRDLPVIRNTVEYHPDGTRTWMLNSDPNHFYHLSPNFQDIPSNFLESSAFLILAMDLQAQEEICKKLRKKNAFIALDR